MRENLLASREIGVGGCIVWVIYTLDRTVSFIFFSTKKQFRNGLLHGTPKFDLWI